MKETSTDMQRLNTHTDYYHATSLLTHGWKNAVKAETLTAEQEPEVLQFLSERSIHTVAMAGFILDNGIVSERNRGVFYGVRDERGQLEAVALIGHAILIEARTDRALQVLAELAQRTKTTHMIMAEKECVASFLKYYGNGGQQLSRSSQQVLFELRWPLSDPYDVKGLRLGTVADLDLIAPVHARMSFDESGVDPLARDPLGFTRRCARRLHKNRTYVLINDDKLLFKADVIAETSEVAYLEGIWANPEVSRNGYALSCLIQLSKILLTRTKSICLLSNIENERAKGLYLKAGFIKRGVYDTIFLQRSKLA